MAAILIVEDDRAVNALVRMNLTIAGHRTVCAFDGRSALEIAETEKPDLAVVDLMLPEIDGWELTRRFYSMNIPVIILTAREGLNDRVKGLNLGADDYMVKPFEPAELLARVAAVLRRMRRQDEIFTLDGVEVYLSAGYAKRDGTEIPLTLKEFELLRALIENRNLTLSHERLLAVVWGYDFMGESRTVDVHIQRLRRKLGWEKRIVAAYKRGYRLEDET